MKIDIDTWMHLNGEQVGYENENYFRVNLDFLVMFSFLIVACDLSIIYLEFYRKNGSTLKS